MVREVASQMSCPLSIYITDEIEDTLNMVHDHFLLPNIVMSSLLLPR